ncbi:MAG: hypothetical protein IJK23_05105 [Clostridia bacterium]|nr:hypothetical protein [Clostridia bacterium]
MAVCPNCGRKLRMTDWKPDCPECGVNLNYFNANERLLVDSEKAEREHARFQPSVDRGKASYAGSKLAILRIVFTLLPVGALFLPLCSKLADGKTTGVNVIDVYKFVNSGDIGAILGAGAFGVSIALLLLSAVMILVCIISIIASLGKHGKGRTIALYSVMAGSAALSLICFLISFPKFGDLFPEMNTVVGGVGIGGILYVFLQIFSWVWNYIVIKKGIPVKYTTCVIGGLPSEEYFSYVEQGMPQSEIRRKMLVALTKMQVEALRKEEKNDPGEASA